MSSKRLATVIAAIVVPWTLVLLGIAYYFVALRDTRQFMSPGDFVNYAQSEIPDFAEAFAGLHDESSMLCPSTQGEPEACIEAFVGDNLTIYRFGSKVVARQFARENTSQRYASDWLVLEFTNSKLSQGAKSAAELAVDEARIAE